jgi:hypothetical protein
MDERGNGHRGEVDVAWKIDAILRRSVVASVVLASTPVGYYYLVHLPRRDAQFESDRAFERLRAAAQKHAEQEQLLFEQRAAEQRAAEQQAREERQALEKANRYQACDRQLQCVTVDSLQSAPSENHQRPGRLR